MKGRNESSIPGSPATTVSHLHFHSYRPQCCFFKGAWPVRMFPEHPQKKKGIVLGGEGVNSRKLSSIPFPFTGTKEENKKRKKVPVSGMEEEIVCNRW